MAGLDNLNEQQGYAATYYGKHLMVIAGAGTGKTRTIIARASYLIRKGVPGRRILILSFTRKSSREIVERIKSQLNSGAVDGLSGRTFHSWCMDMIKNNPTVFKQHDYTVVDEDDRIAAFKLICGKNFKDKEHRTVKPESIVEVYSYAVNAMCPLSEAMRVKLYDNAPKEDESAQKSIELNKPLYADVIKKYIEYKLERRYIDYDDILSIVAKGLKANDKARDFISSKYNHILVDEVQDTNPLQYYLLSNFHQNCHLFCVGDDAQSIYAFRGADFKTMHNFTKIVPDSKLCHLTKNYRSTQPILDFANWLLSSSRLDYGKNLEAIRGNGIKPYLIHWDSEQQEANDIVDKIQSSIAEKGYSYSDNMVLSRSLFGLKRVEAVCIERKIPYVVYGGTGLMQSRHVRDVVAPLRIVSNPKDEIAWMRFLQLWKGIGDVTATKVINCILEAKDLKECVEMLNTMHMQKEIATTLANIADLQYDPATAILKALQVMEPRMKELYGDEWDWRKEDFKVLREVAMDTGGISEFVAEYVIDPKLETTHKEGEIPDDCVILTTIHSAKGLEAKACYLVNVSTFSYPTRRAIANGEESVEEERRCLYVAVTRAKDELYIYRDVHSIHATGQYANDDENMYFLNGLPESLVQTEVLGDFNWTIDDSAGYSGDQIDDSVNDDFDFT